MTSAELIRDLRAIDRLIALLSTYDDADAQDIHDLHWLQATRRSVMALLAVRYEERGKKIVNLDRWRHAGPRQTVGARV